MIERAEFHVMGQPYDGGPLHYTASGLDYVYLLNGYHVENDPDYGRLVTIDAMDDLHRAIGLTIISHPHQMTSAEFRFLRKQMELTQKQLSERLGVDEQTVANYEKGKKIPPMSENLMRLRFALWLAPEDMHAGLIKNFTDLIQRKQRRGALRPTSGTRTAPTADAARDFSAAIMKQWQMGGPTECHA